jgi:hypothetical protein
LIAKHAGPVVTQKDSLKRGVPRKPFAFLGAATRAFTGKIRLICIAAFKAGSAGGRKSPKLGFGCEDLSGFMQFERFSRLYINKFCNCELLWQSANLYTFF